MAFIVGFAVWLVFGIVAGFVMSAVLRSPGTERVICVVLGICGSFIGGMLGTSAHIFHNATPLRAGGLIGAAAGAVFFTFLYHFIARKAV